MKQMKHKEEKERFIRLMKNFGAGISKPFAYDILFNPNISVEFTENGETHEDNAEMIQSLIDYHIACEKIKKHFTIDPRD